jgi:hypothetical protein
MTINVSALSQSTNGSAAAQQSGAAAHTQRLLQEEGLTTTSVAAAPPAQNFTPSITGSPFRRNFLIRQPGLWTRFRLFLCCVSTEITDDHR